MKLLVLREQLQKATSIVAKNISSKTQLPVLSNILLETESGKLRISSTNLETSISFWVGAHIEEAGKTTVPARFFADLIASFTDEKVSITSTGSQLSLVSGSSEATLSGIDASEFPPLPDVGANQPISLETTLLSKSLPFVLIAASHDEGRPLLTGVRFGEKDGKMLLVATDGFRLSVKELPKNLGFAGEVVIPAKTLAEVFRIAGDGSGSIGLVVSADTNQSIFVLENAQISTRLIEGEYPPFQKIIPQSFTTRVILDREEFAKAVKFSSVYAKESANIVKCKIGGDTVVLSANSPQIGENKSTVKARIEGEGGEIAFNVRFLQDVLGVFPDEEVVFEMSGALAPGVFKAVNDPSYLHIIMPVRVQG